MAVQRGGLQPPSRPGRGVKPSAARRPTRQQPSTSKGGVLWRTEFGEHCSSLDGVLHHQALDERHSQGERPQVVATVEVPCKATNQAFAQRLCAERNAPAKVRQQRRVQHRAGVEVGDQFCRFVATT